MMRTLLYDASLAIIICTCAGAVIHPRVHTGVGGSISLLLLALFTVAAFDYEVANWRLGQVVAGAGFCLWMIFRFWWRRSKMKRRLRQVICDACPLHEDR